jgi:serine/threonine-protein kinase
MTIPARVAGRYSIGERLGAGGQGTIHRAWDRLSRRYVDIKFLDPSATEMTLEELSERVRREVSTLARIHTHPAAVPILAAWQENGLICMAMELVSGRNLEEAFANALPAPAGTALAILSQVAGLLDFAHRLGRIHRDIKLSNIMVTQRNQVEVLDWGIVHCVGTTMTRPGQMFASARSAAPEMLRGERLTPRADQFALATVGFRLLTGQWPFDAETPAAAMQNIAFGAPRRAHELNPELPPSSTAVFDRAFRKDPHYRFPSCTAFVEALSRTLQTPQAARRRRFRFVSVTASVPLLVGALCFPMRLAPDRREAIAAPWMARPQTVSMEPASVESTISREIVMLAAANLAAGGEPAPEPVAAPRVFDLPVPTRMARASAAPALPELAIRVSQGQVAPPLPSPQVLQAPPAPQRPEVKEVRKRPRSRLSRWLSMGRADRVPDSPGN